MKAVTAICAKAEPRSKAKEGRPSVGIRELKAKASAIIADVRVRRVTYAVTRRRRVAALIMPADAGERLSEPPTSDSAWDAWQTLVGQLSKESGKGRGSAVAELDRMRR